MAGRGTPIGPRAGKLDAHILVIEAPYYEDVSKALAEGALAVLAVVSVVLALRAARLGDTDRLREAW